MQDSEYLMILADWLDTFDAKRGVTNETEVQDSLRSIAKRLEQSSDAVEFAEWMYENRWVHIINKGNCYRQAINGDNENHTIQFVYELFKQRDK